MTFSGMASPELAWLACGVMHTVGALVLSFESSLVMLCSTGFTKIVGHAILRMF